MNDSSRASGGLHPVRLAGIRRGIEKESLRVTADAQLATTAHPEPLGSALTHPCITTDYSEAQLELITGVHASAAQCLQQLQDIHQFTARTIAPQVLWASSMPCRLPPDVCRVPNTSTFARRLCKAGQPGFAGYLLGLDAARVAQLPDVDAACDMLLKQPLESLQPPPQRERPEASRQRRTQRHASERRQGRTHLPLLQ